ncbi:MAG: ATP-binding protein [Thermomicrobiales bacterium]|nr:ATP-binding protein [Thermomicrobiales bacterium]
MAGYHYQYMASATLVLKGLLHGNLDWVRIKDINAGRVDDFVLCQDNRVKAYQFKHRASGGFTFRDLVVAAPSGSRDASTIDALNMDESDDSRQNPCLIQQLAEGWQLLRESHGLGTTVHLMTNAPASSHDRLRVAEAASGPRHLTAFIDEVWIPNQQGAPYLPTVLPDKWVPAWEQLRVASGLDPDTFHQFVRSCKLEFMVEPTTLLDLNATRDVQQTVADIDHIRHVIFDLAAREPAPVHIERQQLLERLGWTDRFRPRNSHVFPVDEALYQPIDESVHELEEKLDAITGGYLGVFGSPGSGKSTLLTHSLRFRSDRVIRYYAFVPESTGLSIGRGESENFLHDLVLALHNEGFSGGHGTISYDRLALRERFHNQLHMLGDDWSVNGSKTIILVDGLDHVSRGNIPVHSFLEDLPNPASLPEGVIFILGSQTDIVLPDSIIMAVRDQQRRVEMQPLSRSEILSLTERVNPIISKSDAHKARLVELSAGHPLALVYLLNSISQAENLEEVVAVFSDTPVFSGDIGIRYHEAWSQIASDDSVVEALGYAARMRGQVALAWLESWLGFEPLRKLRRHFGHFFRHESGGRSYFFHDSFRVFLAERTSETWPGHVDPERDARLHRDLANRCSQEQSGSWLAWEELYHRVHARQDEVVCERASQEYFRNQVFALRSISAIQDDVNLAIRAAVRQKNLVAFCRLSLAGAELEQRQSHLEQVPLISLLLDLGRPEIAVEHVREGSRLRIARDKALEIIPDLFDAGLYTEAARIFDLAEPLELLRPDTPVNTASHSEEGSLLCAWAEVASRFYAVNKIIGIIRGLSVAPQQWDRESPEKKIRTFQNKLIFRTAMGLILQRRWSDIDDIAESFNPENEFDRDWWLWVHANAWRMAAKVDLDRARTLVGAVGGRFLPHDIDPKARIAIATAAFRISEDEVLARRWIEDVPRPGVDILSFGVDGAFRPFDELYAHTRIKYALDRNTEALSYESMQSEITESGIERFERFVQLVARIEGASWRGDLHSPRELSVAIQPHMYLLDRQLGRTAMGTSWFGVERARAGLVERLIRAVALHGDAAVSAVRTLLEQSWGEIPWSSDDQRSAIVAFKQVGAPATWANAVLGDLESALFNDKLTIERIDDCRYQIEAWMELGQSDHARSMLQRLLLESSSIAFRKDHQLANWIDQWLPEALGFDSHNAGELVRWFAGAILVLEQTTEEGADRTAALSLIGASFQWSPRRSTRLLSWFLDQQMVPFDDALISILEGTLDADDCPVQSLSSIVAEVILPISMDGVPRRLIERLLSIEKQQGGKSRAVGVAGLLAKKAASRALPTLRRGWGHALAQAFESIGIDRTEVDLDRIFSGPDSETSSASRALLKLSDGTEHDVSSVLCDAQSISRVLELLDQEADDSFFTWWPVIKSVAQPSTTEDLIGLVKRIQHHRGSERGRIEVFIAKILMERNEHGLAKSLLIDVLDSDQGLGWDRSWGRGTNLDAAYHLIELDRDRASPQVLDRLIDYLTGESGRYGLIARNLHEIAGLLGDQSLIEMVWPEVERFVRSMFAAHDIALDGLDWLSEPTVRDTSEYGLAELLTLLLNHPVSEIAQGAQRVCALGVLRADSVAQMVVESALGGPSEIQLPVLQLLDAVLLEDTTALSPFKASVIELSDSPDFAVRSIARSICHMMSWESQAIQQISRPVSYDLELPPGPLHLVRPFEDHIAIIARLAMLSEEAIAARMTQLMNEIVEPTLWSSTAENNLFRMIHNVRIHLPCRRPRVQAARSALFRVIAELMDSGDIDQQDIGRFRFWLRVHDPAMILLEPSERPEWLSPMDELGYGQNTDSAWVSKVGQASESQFGDLERSGLTILAMRTEFRQTTQRYPSERGSIWAEDIGRSPAGSGLISGVGRVYGLALNEYSSNLEVDSDRPMVIENTECNAYDTPSSSWLALSPRLGMSMDWHLVENALLPTWVDVNGDEMVRSLWWTDGIIDTGWAAPSNIVGEGWLVLASAPAIMSLQDRYGPLQYKAISTRSIEASDDQPGLERTHEEVRPLPVAESQ